MKRLLLCCSLFLLGVACSNYEELPAPEVPAVATVETDQSADPYRVTVDEALAHADRMLSRGDKTRSLARKVKSYDYYVAKPATRSLGDTIEVAFHLINYEDNGGYALVAADERATPVYMYADEGNLTVSDLQTHPGISIFMDGAVQNYINEVGEIQPPRFPPIDGPITPIVPPEVIYYPMEKYNGVTYFCNTIETQISTAPLTPFYWHQGYPYNYYCSPNAIGCSPTAMGKIMAYYRHPASHNGNVYNWDQITQDDSHYLLTPASKMISRLLCDIGEAHPNIQYGGSTGTNRYESAQAFVSFGYYNDGVRDYSFNLVKDDIDKNRPVWIRGESLNAEEGHAWVIDAYNAIEEKKLYYNMVYPYPLEHTVIRHKSVYFRCVWGWTGWSGANYSYCLGSDFGGLNYDVDVISGIIPNN